MSSSAGFLHIDTNLFSALGHALDDEVRFLSACMQFAERNYEFVKRWFVREFQFLERQDSEDALHEFFVTLSGRLMGESPQAKLNKFKNDSQSGKLSFHLYLKAIAQNAARDFVRKRRRSAAKETLFTPEIMEEKIASVMELVIQGESDAMLQDIRKRTGISDRDWKIFVSSLGQSAAEIAATTKLTCTAIHVINSRVRKKLQEMQSQILEKYGMIGRLIISDADQLSCATHPLES